LDVIVSINEEMTDAQMQAVTGTTNHTPALLDTNIGSGKWVSWSLDDSPHGASLGDGVQHVNGTWSVSSGVLVNSPTPGSNVIDNHEFDNWTGTPPNDTPDDWSIGGTQDASNYVTEDSSKAHFVSDGTAIDLRQASKVEAGKWYKTTVNLDTVTSGGLKVYTGTVNTVYQTDIIDDVGDNVSVNRSGGTGIYVFRFAGATDVVIASVKTEELTLSGLLTGTTTKQVSNPRWQYNSDPDAGHLVGCAMFLDSLSNPTEGLIIYENTHLDKIIIYNIGTDSELSATSYTPSAGAQVQVYRGSDGKIYIIYNDTFIVATSYTPTAGALYCALFDTGSPTGAISSAVLWDDDQCNHEELL
jgi:hypothetical protein